LAVGAKLAFDPATGPIIENNSKGEECAIAPLDYYVKRGTTITKVDFTATATLTPFPAGTHQMKFKTLPAGQHTVRFVPLAGRGDFVTTSASVSDPETKVVLDPSREADGKLDLSDKQGVYLLETVSLRTTVSNLGVVGVLKQDKGQMVQWKSGSISPLIMICPDIAIVAPKGDPERPPVPGDQDLNANPGNEPVFDDQTPATEGPGECIIEVEGESFPGLKATNRDWVWSMLYWNIEDAGDVLPEYRKLKKPATSNGKTWMVTEVKYPRMPQNNSGFGAKYITLTFWPPRWKKWNYYQKVELFFHARGTADRGGDYPEPNMFYYWKQIPGVAPTAAPGNPGFSFRHGLPEDAEGQKGRKGTKWHWESNWTAAGTRSWITIYDGEIKSLSMFLGIAKGHEQKHETDYWAEIWAGGGYVPANDADRDGLRDAWERTQPMGAGTGYGPWTFDVPAAPTLPAVTGTNAAWDNGAAHTAAFESEGAFRSWSDARADVAAVQVVNIPNNLGIDAQDWSDLEVPAGWVLFFEDEDRPPGERQIARPTTHSNNKHYHRP